jgi:uncharacterized membrane protein HdeD (DUF308 family)
VALASLLATPLKPRDLAAKLWRVSLLRGLVALGLGAYVVSHPITSSAALVHVVAVYWIVDGLVALWASLFAAPPGSGCGCRSILNARIGRT